MAQSVAGSRRLYKAALAALILGIGLASISSDSLWWDEVSHAQYLVHGNLVATVRDGLRFGKLGYLLTEFLWATLLGDNKGEFALRLSNLLFTLPAIYYTFRIVERKGWPLWASLLFFLHPMYVYYMNEVTPYILLYALALGFIYHVFFTGEQFNAPANIIAINIIFMLGVFIHFIFGFIVLLYFTRCLMTIRHEPKLIRRHAVIMLAFGIAYVPLIYLILRYMRGTATGFSLLNPLYVIYSFLGMAGLGLSRDDLRQRNFGAISSDQILLLSVFTLIALAILLYAICQFMRSKTSSKRIRSPYADALNQECHISSSGDVAQAGQVTAKAVYKAGFFSRNMELLLPLLVYFTVMILVAIPMHFGMWERHCIVVFPVYILLFGDLMFQLGKTRVGKILFALFLSLLMISCVRLRLDDAYNRDDFKDLYTDLRAELQTNDDLVIMMQRVNEYYNLDDAIVSPNQKLISIDGMKALDAHHLFLDHIADGDDVVMVLAFNSSNPNFFHYYDDRPNFTVDDTYTCFKVIRPTQ